jgi:hypothetical protein
MRMRRAATIFVLAGALLLSGCPKPAPVVQHRTYAKTSGLFKRVVVVPFSTSPRIRTSGGADAMSPDEIAALMQGFVSEAIGARGISVIPASDVMIAAAGSQREVAGADPSVAAAFATRKFGATSIVVGQVMRYLEREGGPSGAFAPASVAFTVTLYSAPEAERVWSARFDETQHSITGNLMRAREYPGGGTRWLTAGELARWGIERAMDAVPVSVR